MPSIARRAKENLVAYGRVKRIITETDDPTERKIRFMAVLTSSLPKSKPKPVLTGGSAIEVYLDGTLRTGDMDVVCDTNALFELLKGWRFERVSRSWANEELGLAVDAVGDSLSGSQARTTTITTEYGPATIIGAEDLILKRLGSAKHWRYPTDMEQAYLLAGAHEDRLDWKYLDEEAERGGISDYLEKLRGMMRRKGRVSRKNPSRALP